jgi:hypothetical protein
MDTNIISGIVLIKGKRPLFKFGYNIPYCPFANLLFFCHLHDDAGLY